jgi:mRNA interferase YafQ
MFEIVTSTKFFKDLKLLKKRSLTDFQLLQNVITTLASKGHTGLDKKHKAHKPFSKLYADKLLPPVDNQH